MRGHLTGTNWSIEVENSQRQQLDFGHKAEKAKELQNHFEHNKRHIGLDARQWEYRASVDTDISSNMKIVSTYFINNTGKFQGTAMSHPRCLKLRFFLGRVFWHTPRTTSRIWETGVSDFRLTHHWDQGQTTYLTRHSAMAVSRNTYFPHTVDILLSERWNAGSSNTRRCRPPKQSYSGLRGLLPYVPAIAAVLRKIRADRLCKIIGGWTQLINHLDNKSPVPADPITHESQKLTNTSAKINIDFLYHVSIKEKKWLKFLYRAGRSNQCLQCVIVQW